MSHSYESGPTPQTGRGHLVVTRRCGESIMIGDNIELVLVDVQADSVRIGITAPASVKILRRELYDANRRAA